MEYTIESFTIRLRELMYDNFPNLPERGINPSGTHKHKNNREIRDVAFKDNATIFSENTTIFEIGNENAERNYPYYHILQDSPVIRKRNKGTTKTKGSQAKVENLGQRDYGKVEWNGKTFTKEYQRNVRGKRNRLNSVSHWSTNANGERIWVNRESNAYINEHYHYIEKMFNEKGILDTLANEFGMTRKRTINGGIQSDYAYESEHSNMFSYNDIQEGFGFDITSILLSHY